MKSKPICLCIFNTFTIIVLLCNSCTNNSQKNIIDTKLNITKRAVKQNMLKMILTIPNKNDTYYNEIDTIKGFRHLRFGMSLSSLDTRGWFMQDHYEMSKYFNNDNPFKILSTEYYIENKEKPHITNCYFFKDTLYKIELCFNNYNNLYNDLLLKYGLPNHSKFKTFNYSKKSKKIDLSDYSYFNNGVVSNIEINNLFISNDMEIEYRRIEKPYLQILNELSNIERYKIENKIRDIFKNKCKLTLVTQSRSSKSIWKLKHCYIIFERLSENKYYIYKNEKYSATISPTDESPSEQFSHINILTFIPVKYFNLESTYQKLPKEKKIAKEKIKPENLDYI